jgi:hypothetical protein
MAVHLPPYHFKTQFRPVIVLNWSPRTQNVANNGLRKNSTIRGIIILNLWRVKLRKTPFGVTYSRAHVTCGTMLRKPTLPLLHYKVKPFGLETEGHIHLPLHILMSFSEKCSEITDLCCWHFVLYDTVTSWSASFIHLALAILTA